CCCPALRRPRLAPLCELRRDAKDRRAHFCREEGKLEAITWLVSGDPLHAGSDPRRIDRTLFGRVPDAREDEDLIVITRVDPKRHGWEGSTAVRRWRLIAERRLQGFGRNRPIVERLGRRARQRDFAEGAAALPNEETSDSAFGQGDPEVAGT